MKVIVRHAKHKSLGTIAAASAHTMRRRPTPNADPAKPAPEIWVGSDSPMADVKATLPAKRRKNAVLALEYVLTASPAFFAEAPEPEWRGYLAAQLAMLQGYYRAENVVSAVLHLDEKTPHLSVMVVPLVDGKLNARALVGTREACRALQDLAGEAGKPFGLARGQKGSQAKHQDVRRFYAEIHPAIERVQKAGDAAQIREQAVAEREAIVKRAGAKVRADLEALNLERKRLQVLAASLTPIEEERAAATLAKLADDARARPVPLKPIQARPATLRRAPAP